MCYPFLPTLKPVRNASEAPVREVCRSEPTFRKRLLVSSALFIALFLADLFLFANLAFRDLSHRVIDEAFRASLEALGARAPLPPMVAADEPEPEPPLPTEACPPGDRQTPATGRPCITARPLETPGPVIFRSMDYRWQRIVTDTRGRVLWRGFVEGRRADLGRSPAPTLRPGYGEVGEEWEVGGRRQSVIALHRPADGGAGEVREIGIPKEQIDQELQQLQSSLQTKLWIGAGLAVLILLVAFLYVLRLLHRTRLLEAQAQMDDRLAFVGGLAAGLAHEIRNPLNVLSMNLQMLEEEITAGKGSQGEEARAYMATLQGEIRRLSNLVNNFLTYARPNQPRFATRDLNEVLADICLLVRPEFETRELSLIRDLSPYLPPVDLDEGQIRQAVMNILINATQVLKPGGTVWLRSRVGPAGEAIITIEDNGPGIKPEDRERIFEIFFSSRGGGTGLGLPIAARIMEAHGGSIAVESEPGKGARFILKLPRRQISAAAPLGSAAGALAAPGGS